MPSANIRSAWLAAYQRSSRLKRGAGGSVERRRRAAEVAPAVADRELVGALRQAHVAGAEVGQLADPGTVGRRYLPGWSVREARVSPPFMNQMLGTPGSIASPPSR